MSLIEQLGGYEKAKEYLVELQRIPMHEQTEDTISYLPDALLEYRRQHNIFEVGDKVVEITDYPSNDVLTVTFISDKLLVCESDDLNASYVLSSKYESCFYVRHAIDEEVSCQRRF